jgi:hypothetical protein
MKHDLAFAAALALTLALTGPARADLMSGHEAQIENWLGQGPLTFTNVFTTTTGDGKTSQDFYHAVDGIGPTIVLYQVNVTRGNSAQLIGGYNPRGWDEFGDWHISDADSDRSAFLFNLCC